MTDDNFQNLPLNESFERVAKVAKERDAFNEQMALREVLMAVTQDDIVERLRALHVWPQSTADTYPDTLGPRRIKALYEVGEVAHEAADRIEALIAENERLEALFTNSTYEAKAMMEEIDRRGAEIQALREMQGKDSHD